jgi:phosphatidylserine/phosphatidylglycerophosphate/cardiolipin synthase-like enzyme
MAAFFPRPKVRNRLNEMAAAGCTVRVIARTDSITREFCDSLQAPIQVRIADKPSATRVGIHGKYLTISGGFEGATDRQVVWMGSHNLTRNALVRNDETFVLTDDNALYAAFRGNYEAIWADPSLTAGCGRAGGASQAVIEEEANTEVTKLIKEKQRVGRKLPKRLKKKRTPLRSTRTVEGKRLRTRAKCRVVGSGKKLKKRKICPVKRPKTNPTLVLKYKGKKKLKVRIIQTAKGSATLLPYKRSKTYIYRPARKGRS